MSLLIGCDYNTATFYYADIIPKAPTNIKITATNSTSATIKWTAADDSAYPLPEFNIYTAIDSQTNLMVSVSNQVTQTNISNLINQTTYRAWVEATNRAGAASSKEVTFTTP